jgi:hypothetical protein
VTTECEGDTRIEWEEWDVKLGMWDVVYNTFSLTTPSTLFGSMTHFCDITRPDALSVLDMKF